MNRFSSLFALSLVSAVTLTACEPAPPPGPANVAAAPECAPLEPEVLLVVEASDRMMTPMPGVQKQTRWEWLVKGLKKSLPHLKAQADLGLLVFPAVTVDGGVPVSEPATVAVGKGDSAWWSEEANDPKGSKGASEGDDDEVSDAKKCTKGEAGGDDGEDDGKGAKGDDGEDDGKGAKGDDGEDDGKGAKGDDGEDDGKGAKGDDGEDDGKGAKGDDGDDDGKGAKGDDGDDGDDDKGGKGDDDDDEGGSKGSCGDAPPQSGWAATVQDSGTSTSAAAEAGRRGAACQASGPQVAVGSPYGHLVSTLERTEPVGGSPVAAALRRAAEDFGSRDPAGRSRHVVLVVDGADSCEGAVLPEIRALRDLGVDVWVVSFADVDASATLDAWAVAGGHPQAGPRAWFALDANSDLSSLGSDLVAAASEEVCDGLDNDCDGAVDEDLTRACLDSCGGGEQRCVAGTWRACGATDERAPEEYCDGVDNDCDGEVDEGFGVGEACSADVGPCSFAGVMACDASGEAAACETGDQWPTSEVCDGQDNDCDGQIDEGAAEDCSDACHSGSRACVDGVLGECVLGEPYAEVCDGEDNDCDGEVDEGFSVGDGCIAQSGDCLSMGTMECTEDGQGSVCVGTAAVTAAPEVCNGLDDDCNGIVDDGPVGICPGGQVCYAGTCIWD